MSVTKSQEDCIMMTNPVHAEKKPISQMTKPAKVAEIERIACALTPRDLNSLLKIARAFEDRET